METKSTWRLFVVNQLLQPQSGGNQKSSTYYSSHKTTLERDIYSSYLGLMLHALLRQGLVQYWPLIHAFVSVPAWNLG